MAQISSQQRASARDDFDVEARKPSVPAVIALAAVASALALSIVYAAGALLFGT